MRRGIFLLFVLGSSVAPACGGRYESNPRADESVAGTGAGGTNAAGTNAVAGTTSRSGSGTTGSAGQASVCPPCPLPECPSREHLVPNADGCCQHCEPVPDDCQQQKSDYAKQREQVIAEFASFPCMIDMDCLSAWDPSNCSRDCSFVIVTGARRGVIDRLVTLGQQTCTGDCVYSGLVECPPPPPARCVMGQCVLQNH